MGITGLWKIVQPATRPVHIREFSGSTIGIDAMILLHQGASRYAGCSPKSAERYCDVSLNYARMFQDFGIKPLFVIDGQPLPSKQHTNTDRKRRRDLTTEKAFQLQQQGDMQNAAKYMKQGHEITWEMINTFIGKLRDMSVDYIVSPYESDSQLYFLEANGTIDAVLTRDSDLVAFGCQRVIYEFALNGDCRVFERSKLNLCRELPFGISVDRLRYICILSGCDYEPSLPGIGLKSAIKIVNLLRRNGRMEDLIPHIPGIVNKEYGHDVLTAYMEQFKRADDTFRHQIIFDNTIMEQRPLSPYSRNADYSYAGIVLHKRFAITLSLGNVNCRTLEITGVFNPLDNPSFMSQTQVWKNLTLQDVRDLTQPLRRSVRLSQRSSCSSGSKAVYTQRTCNSSPDYYPSSIPLDQCKFANLVSIMKSKRARSKRCTKEKRQSVKQNLVKV